MLIHFACRDLAGVELTMCHRAKAPWVAGQARPATADEVKAITAAALERYDR
jgi:hypothetical protein